MKRLLFLVLLLLLSWGVSAPVCAAECDVGECLTVDSDKGAGSVVGVATIIDIEPEQTVMVLDGIKPGHPKQHNPYIIANYKLVPL